MYTPDITTQEKWLSVSFIFEEDAVMKMCDIEKPARVSVIYLYTSFAKFKDTYFEVLMIAGRKFKNIKTVEEEIRTKIETGSGIPETEPILITVITGPDFGENFYVSVEKIILDKLSPEDNHKAVIILNEQIYESLQEIITAPVN